MTPTAQTPGTAQFKFYTYDPTGRVVTIPIWAATELEACDKFDLIYGTETIVIQVDQVAMTTPAQ